MRSVRVLLLAAGIAALFLTPGIAMAKAAASPGLSSTAYSGSQTLPSAPGTNTYDLSFTLPTAGKSGCMVCHGDPNIIRIENGRAVSIWISSRMLEQSAHANIQCTGCHLDFAYSIPHANSKTGAWRDVAKAACKNCHQDAFAAYSKSAHSPAPTPGTKIQAATTTGVTHKPLCGDCHGSHDIKPLKNNPAGVRALHAKGKQICGECHADYWANYNDYYHGAAYLRGASDAPACWQCHGAHDILPSDDRRSRVNTVNLVETCSQCHRHEPNLTYTSYATFVHKRSDELRTNPVYAFLQRVRQTVQSWLSRDSGS